MIITIMYVPSVSNLERLAEELRTNQNPSKETWTEYYLSTQYHKVECVVIGSNFVIKHSKAKPNGIPIKTFMMMVPYQAVNINFAIDSDVSLSITRKTANDIVFDYLNSIKNS